MNPKEDDAKLESLLAGTSLIDPSPFLDQRIEQLFRPLWKRMLGPACGFAAGVLVTASVALATLHQRQTPAQPSTAQPAIHVQQAPAAAPTVLTVWAEPRRVSEEIDGYVNGVPVRLERTREQLDLLPNNPSAEILPAQVTLPESENIHQLMEY
jgi:hypothetical protein